MDPREELRQLRKDLDDVMIRASRIARRLDEMESKATAQPVVVETSPKVVVPPPMPKMAELVEPEITHEPLTSPELPRSEELVAPQLTPAPPTTVEVWAKTLSDKVQAFIQGQIDKTKAQAKEVGWEVVLGTYWLPRVAVVCISIAVVFFLSLAVERWGREWMPHLRVGIGYAVTAGLLLAAWRSEKKYPGFSRVVYGGAFAVMYFVSFATHYVKYARIFDTPTPSLVLLAAIVLTWTVAAEIRKSKAVAVMVAVLGNFTVLLSALTLRNPGIAGTVGILALSCGGAFFLLRNRWYSVATIAMIGAYINDFVLLAKGKGTDPVWDFTAAMTALSVFFLVFALSELFAPEQVRRKSVPTWFRTGYLSLNTASFLILGTILIREFSFARGHQDIFRFATALALLLIGLGYLRLRGNDPLFNTYIVKAVAVGTAGLATHYGGSTLTACLGVEIVVLLFSAHRSGLLVTRILSQLVAVLALIHAFAVAWQALTPDIYPPIAKTDAVVTVLSFLLAALLYERTDWKPRSPDTVFLPTNFLRFCWWMDWVNDNPDGKPEKHCKGACVAHLYSVAGGICALLFICAVVSSGDRFATIALCAVGLTLLAHLFGSIAFCMTAILLATTTCVACKAELSGTISHSPLLTVIALACAIFLALTTESHRIGRTKGLDYFHLKQAPYLLYGLGALQIGMVCLGRLTHLSAGYALVALALGCAGLMLILHPKAMSVISTAYAICAAFWCMIQLGHLSHAGINEYWRLFVFVTIASLLLLDRFNAYFGDRTPTATGGSLAGVILSMLTLWVYSWIDLKEAWAILVVLACYAYCGYGFFFRSPAAALTGIITVVFASFAISGSVLDAKQYNDVTTLAFLLLAGFWIGVERLLANARKVLPVYFEGWRAEAWFDADNEQIQMVPIGVANLLMIIMIASGVSLSGASPAYITMGWFGLAAAGFMLSLVIPQKGYRLAGLAIIFLSLARLFLMDMAGQDPLFRVAAFAVVGTGLLVISIGYYKWMKSSHPDNEAVSVEKAEEAEREDS